MAKIQINKVSGTRYSAHVKTTPEEKQACDTKAMEKVRSKAKLDGFRKGKIPEHIIKSRYGAEIEESAIQSLIEMSSEQLVKESELNIYKIRKIEKLEEQKGGGYSFDILYDLYPQVNLGKMKGLMVKENIPLVEDSDLDKEIQEFRKKFAEKKIKGPQEKAQKGDLAIVSYEHWEEGVPVGEPVANVEVYLGEMVFDEEVEKKLLDEGAQKDSEYRFSRKFSRKDADGNPQEKDADIIIKVENIYEVVYPELNDDLIKKFDPDYESVNAFKEDIRNVLNKRFHRKNMDEEIGTLIEQLNETAEVEFPENYVREQFQKYLHDNRIPGEKFSEEQFNEFLTSYERELKKRIINEHLLKEAMEGLKTEDYHKGFIAYVEDNFDKKMSKTFKMYYQSVIDHPDNKGANEWLDRLFGFYHLSLLENYFKSKGMVKKDKKISYSEYIKENKEASNQ